MTDILTHALAMLAGAVPMWLVMRGDLNHAKGLADEWLAQAERWQTLHDRLVLKARAQHREIAELRASLPKPQPRDAKGHFVKRT